MKMNRNNHFTLSVIDSWGICSDKYNKQPGAVLSLNAVCNGGSRMGVHEAVQLTYEAINRILFYITYVI